MKTKDHFWIEYPKTHNDQAKVGNLVLFKDPSYKEAWNRILYGNVVEKPYGFSKKYEHLEGAVNLGERIYFKYLVAEPENMHQENGKQYLKVPVWDTFCFVRKEIHTYNDVVLCSPKWEEHEEVEVGDKKMKAKTKGNLVVGLDIKYDKRLVKVEYANSELFKRGDTVVMDRHCDEKYEIEGKEYFVMRESNVLCKID
jgi:co-chaperonin GroES (HSP10)